MRILLVAIVLTVVVQPVFSQKKCDCPAAEEFVKHRDFDEVTEYRSQNLLRESKTFEKSKLPACRAFGAHLKGIYALKNARFEEAKKQLDYEKFLLDSLRCKGLNLLENTIGYGDYYLRVGAYESAIEQYNKALRLLSNYDNKTLLAQVLLSLSNAQSKNGQEDRARGYIKQAHPVVLLLPNGPNKVEALYNLSARYYYHYRLNNDVSLLDSAQHMAGFGIGLARKIDYQEGFIRGYNLLEDKQYHEKNYRQALIFLDSALYFTQPGLHQSERQGIYADMADIYLELKKYDKAYVCADSSLVYARLTGNPYRQKEALELLYNCAKLNGEYERALLVYEDIVLMRDSVQRIENNKLFSELEDKYHRVRKEKTETEYEQDKELLKKQREIGNLRSRLITVGIVISALLLLYILIIFRQKSIRQRQKRLEVEQRLEKARINPDFVYKALANMQKLAVNDPTNEVVAKKLSSFMKLMKQTLESSHEDFLTLDKEVEFLTLYMELQRDRLKKQFTFEFNIDEQMDLAKVCLPAMIVQPFIESTIEQGFKQLNHEGHISIAFRQQENELLIRISDNGLGLKSGSSGRATEIINDRFYLLNKMNKTSSSYLIRERSTGGVQVEIFLPFITLEMAEAMRRID